MRGWKEQGMKDRREETIEKIVKKVVEMSDEEFQKFLEFLKTIWLSIDQ